MKYAPLKLIITILILLNTIYITAQTTYTFTGTGNWTDEANWSPSYPGGVISYGSSVIISTDATVVLNLDINNSGFIQNNGDFTNEANFINNGIFLNSFDANFANDSFFANYDDFDNDGNFTNSSTFNNNSIFINDHSFINDISGDFTNDISGDFRNDSGFTNNGDFTNKTELGDFTNYGTFKNYSNFINQSQNTGETGLFLNKRNFINEGNFTNANGGSTLANFVNYDFFINNGDFTNNFFFQNLQTFTNNGTLKGSGLQSNNFINGGILSPGNSSGKYTFDANYTHNTDANLEIELESTSSFDQVLVSGTANLSGTLDVSFINGFIATTGDTFTILTAGSVSGTFATTNLPAEYNNWNVIYTATEVILEVTQTTYTYTGTGNWTDEANWSPSYPGTRIFPGDTAIINGDLTVVSFVEVSGDLNNNGTFRNEDVIYCNGVFKNQNGGILINEGTITSSGGGGTLYSWGSLLLTNSTSAIIRGIVVLQGSGILNNDGYIDTLYENNGTINNTTNGSIYSWSFSQNGTINNSGVLDLYGPEVSNSGTINNSGVLDFGGDYMENYGTLDNTGRIDVSGTIWNDGVINNNINGNLYIWGTGTLENWDTITNNGNLNNLGTLENYDTLSGENITHTNNFINGGILSPGYSSGTYTFDANYTHNTDANLEIELESTSSFDKLAVTNTASLNGILNVSLINGFTPSIGDSFTILTANTVSGAFTTTNLPAGFIWDITYNASNVVLEVTNTLSTLDFEISQFKLYPNPASNEFTIELGNSIILEEVNIYNNIGQLVLTSKESRIKTSSLAKGIYLVKVTTNEGKATKKIIVE